MLQPSIRYVTGLGFDDIIAKALENSDHIPIYSMLIFSIGCISLKYML